jgi:hypothetical protein
VASLTGLTTPTDLWDTASLTVETTVESQLSPDSGEGEF